MAKRVLTDEEVFGAAPAPGGKRVLSDDDVFNGGVTTPTAGGFAPRVAREGMPVNRKQAMREEIDANRFDRFNPLGKLATGLRSFVGMVPFGEDAVAGLATVLPADGDYSLPAAERFARNRDYVEAQRESDWATDKVSSVAGGALALLGPGGKYIAGAKSLPGTMFRSGVVGGAYGTGAGLSSNGSVEERVTQGVQQGALGLGLGAAAPAVVKGVAAGANEVFGPMVSRYRQWRDPDAAADRMLGNAIRADQQAGRTISQADLGFAEREGLPLVLGDIGGDTTRGLARAAANANPVARGTMETVLDPRFEAQNTRMGNFISNMFDFPDPMAMSERLRAVSRVANNPAYRQLYDDFPMVGNDDLLDMVRNVPEVRAAAKEVMDRVPGLKAAGMSDGRMSAGPMPSMEFWDRLQRELRDKANGASGDRAAELSTLYGNLRNRIVDQLDALTGGRYGEVRGQAARFFRADDAIEAGQNFFRQNRLNDLAGARKAIESMSEADRKLFAQGFAAELAHATGNTRPGQNIGVQSWLTTPNAKEKMRLAFGTDRADSVEMMVNVENAMNRLRSEVKGNSTSVRQLIESGVMGAGLNTMLGGEFGWSTLTSPEGIMLALARGAASRNKGLSPAVAERLARRLISNDPKVVEGVLKQAQRSEAISKFLSDFQSQMIKLGSIEGDAVLPAPKGYAEGGPVDALDSMAGMLPPGAAEPMREEFGPPAPPMTAERLPELDSWQTEKAIGRGAVEAVGTAGRYLRDTPLSQIPRDVGKVGGMMWEGIKEDPMGAVLDVLPGIGQVRAAMDADELAEKAAEAEAAGNPTLASELRQFATLAAAGVVPGAGLAGKGAKKAAKAAIPSMTLPEDIVAASHPGRISTRLPTAVKKVDDPVASHLTIGLNEMKADPEFFEANANLLRDYPNLPEQIAVNGTPDEVAEAMVEHAKDNLLWLYGRVPPEIRERSQQWYDGARAITDRWVERYGIPDTSVAGVLAALSPQKDWFQNVSLGERVLDIVKTKGNHIWDDPMEVKAAEIFGGEKYKPLVDLVRGKSFSELKSPEERALWLRLYDEAYNDRGHRLVTPEGEFGDFVVDKDALASGTGWGSLNEIGKAIEAALSDGSRESLSGLMGERHKVRNFFNNILDPNGPHGDVTMDTHAVAAALLRPLSGNSLEVAQNFANSLDKKFQQKIAESGRTYAAAKGSAVTGVQGLYPLYAEAYRRAAAEAGILPRQMQSITWEAVRGLFKDTFKSDQRNVASIDEIWYKYRRGELTLDEARDQIEAAAGGIDPPDWWGRDAVAHAQSPNASYAGELPADRVLRAAPGGVDDRARAGAAQGAAGSENLVWRERPAEGGNPGNLPGNPEALRDVGRGNSGPDGRHVRVLDDPSGRYPAFGELAPANAGVFHEALAKAKGTGHSRMASVSLYSPEDYAGMRTFLTEDGTAGFAIKPDGDIVSVFNTPGGPHRGLGEGMIPLAVQMGGRKLDAFDTTLPDLYSKAGFRAVARTRFNDEFAPEGWDRAAMQRFNGGRPDIVFMVWDPKHTERYNPGDGRVFASYEDAAAAQAVEADRIWAQEQRAKRKPKKKLARGGMVDSSPRELHKYFLATSNLAPPPRRFAMGGPVFPAAVEPRMNALTRPRRGALSQRH